jgi:hypothetical protein
MTKNISNNEWTCDIELTGSSVHVELRRQGYLETCALFTWIGDARPSLQDGACAAEQFIERWVAIEGPQGDPRDAATLLGDTRGLWRVDWCQSAAGHDEETPLLEAC